MRKSINCLVVALLCGSVFTFGCAKKEMVRHDEALPSTTKSDTASQGKTPATEEIADQESVRDTAVSSEQMPDETSISTGRSSLEIVYFDFDSYLLSRESREKLQRNAQWLKKNAGPKVQVEGHTDERGSDAYNITLGEKRANSVMNYLVTLGISASRLSIISYGEENPAEQGAGEEAWARNRRVEFSIVER